MASRSTLAWIQLLRGVAAVLVVLAHARTSLLGTPGIALARLASKLTTLPPMTGHCSSDA